MQPRQVLFSILGSAHCLVIGQPLTARAGHWERWQVHLMQWHLGDIIGIVCKNITMIISWSWCRKPTTSQFSAVKLNMHTLSFCALFVCLFFSIVRPFKVFHSEQLVRRKNFLSHPFSFVFSHIPFTLLRTPSANCPTAANSSRSHLPLDPAKCQQHKWGRSHYRQGGGVPHCIGHHVRPAAGGQDHAQDRPPGPGHWVRDQRSAHQTSGWRNWSPRAATQGQDQMCW